jgi:hypothetical protein
MEREVMLYTPLARAAKAVTATPWVPVTKDEVLSRAPEIDFIYEKAVGLHGKFDESIRPLMEAQLPTVAARFAVTKGLIELERAMAFFAYLDFRLWWHVIAPVLLDEPEPANRVRIRNHARMTKTYEHLTKDRYANLIH